MSTQTLVECCKIISSCGICLFALVETGFTAHAAAPAGHTIYVDCTYTGDGSNGGSATPFKTIQNGSDVAKPGDTVIVRDGIYSEHVYPHSGTATAYITYRAEHRWKARVESPSQDGCFHLHGERYEQFPGEEYPAGPRYVVIDGFDLENSFHRTDPNGPAADGKDAAHIDGGDYAGGVSITWAHHICVKNCLIHGCRFSGIQTNYSDYLTIDHNSVYDNAANSYLGPSGISIWKVRPYDHAGGFHNRVSGNRVYHNGELMLHHSDGNGIIIDTTAIDAGTVVENNVVFDNGGSGILLDGADNCTVRYNTLFHNSQDTNLKYPEVLVQAVTWESGFENTPSRNCQVYGNILVPADDRNAVKMLPDSVNCTVHHNLRLDSLAGDTSGVGDVTAAPQFVRPSTTPLAADFHLKSNSPAIGAGYENTSDQNDFDGLKRSGSRAADLGAYEYAQTRG